LFVERENHQIIVSDISELEDKIENEDNYVDEFITWFTKYDGDKHNYFSFAFLGNKEKLKSELLKYEKIYESEFNSKIFTVKINQIQDLINTIKINLEKPSGLFFEFSAKK
jgi:membrane-anchored protein YejM (alkaline phosphatase superfamily)